MTRHDRRGCVTRFWRLGCCGATQATTTTTMMTKAVAYSRARLLPGSMHCRSAPMPLDEASEHRSDAAFEVLKACCQATVTQVAIDK